MSALYEQARAKVNDIVCEPTSAEIASKDKEAYLRRVFNMVTESAVNHTLALIEQEARRRADVLNHQEQTLTLEDNPMNAPRIMWLRASQSELRSLANFCRSQRGTT